MRNRSVFVTISWQVYLTSFLYVSKFDAQPYDGYTLAVLLDNVCLCCKPKPLLFQLLMIPNYILHYSAFCCKVIKSSKSCCSGLYLIQ